MGRRLAFVDLANRLSSVSLLAVIDSSELVGGEARPCVDDLGAEIEAVPTAVGVPSMLEHMERDDGERG